MRSVDELNYVEVVKKIFREIQEEEIREGGWKRKLWIR